MSFWNEADAGDVAATDFTFTLSVGARAFAGIARYDDVVTTGGSPVAAVVTTPTSDGNNNGDPAVASSVTTTAPGQYVVAVFGEGDGDSIAIPTGMSALFNRGRTTGVEGRVAAFDVSQAAAGASGTKSADLGGNQPWAAHTIALKTEPTKLGFSTPARTGRRRRMPRPDHGPDAEHRRRGGQPALEPGDQRQHGWCGRFLQREHVHDRADAERSHDPDEPDRHHLLLQADRARNRHAQHRRERCRCSRHRAGPAGANGQARPAHRLARRPPGLRDLRRGLRRRYGDGDGHRGRYAVRADRRRSRRPVAARSRARPRR